MYCINSVLPLSYSFLGNLQQWGLDDMCQPLNLFDKYYSATQPKILLQSVFYMSLKFVEFVDQNVLLQRSCIKTITEYSII